MAENMEALQMTCFEIISYVGAAKSMYVEAVRKAKDGDFDAVDELIRQGDEAFGSGHEAHMKLLQADAAGEREPVAPLILLHAEDQMASAETVKLMALNLVDVHRELRELRAKLA